MKPGTDARVPHEELIRSLARDLTPSPRPPRLLRQVGQFLLWSAAIVFVFTKAGTAASLTPAPLPMLATLTMAVAGALAAVASSIPGRRVWGLAAILATAGLCVWTADVAWRSVWALESGGDAWGTARWSKCMGFTTAVSMAGAVVLFRIVCRGWPLRPRLTAGLTFLAGASVAAFTTTLECPSNAPLHVLLGHLVPVLGVVMLGAGLTSRFFTPALHRQPA